MKKFTLLLFFISILVNAQNQRFSYEYKFITDSTNASDVKTEIMLLEVLPGFSKYYSETAFKSDSIMKATLEKELAATGSMNVKSDLRKGFVRDVIIKENPNFKTYLITRIGISKIRVLENRKLNWKILPDKQKFGELNAQKATTEFGGRKWSAWFTTEIPIQDGPYKFHGLPGLIVKVEDATKSHSFELKGIKKLSAADVKNINPKENSVFDFGENLEMDYPKYKKFFLENRSDPNKTIRANMNQSDIKFFDKNGKPMETSEFLRNREKEQKEKINKDNNIIELDLLK